MNNIKVQLKKGNLCDVIDYIRKIFVREVIRYLIGWFVTVGSKNLTTLAHFKLSPKPMLRRKNCPRTNEESPNGPETSPRTILFSARPTQILEGKNGTPSTAASQSVPRKRTSVIGQPQGHYVGTAQGETVISALNAHN